MSRRLLVILLAAVLVLSTIPLPVATTATESLDDSRSGIAVEMVPADQQRYLDQLGDIQERFGVESKDNAFWLRASGEDWVVFTDERPKSGEATVTGRVLSPEILGGSDFGVIVADSVSVNQTGEQVELSELKENPSAFDGELVRVNAPYQQMPMAVESEGDLSARLVTGGTFETIESSVQSPAELAEWSTFNASSAESLDSALQTQLNTKPSVVGSGTPEWWINAPTTVDLGVVIENGQPTYYLVQTSVQSTSVSGVNEIHSQGDNLAGKVVSFESSVVGGRISSQEAILSVSQCAPMSATNPATGCIPIPTDTTLHSGVLFSGIPDSRDDVVPYVGLSSHHQQSVLTDERGTYRVTGRVVQASQMNEASTDGYGLVVYDMERTGDLTASSDATSRAAAWHQERQESYRNEVQSASEPNQDSEVSQSQNQSTTATAQNATTTTESSPATSNTASSSNETQFLEMVSQLLPQSTLMIAFAFGAVVSWLSVFVIEILRGIKSLRGHEVETSDRVVEFLFALGAVLLVLSWATGGPGILLIAGGGVGVLFILMWLGKWVYREI